MSAVVSAERIMAGVRATEGTFVTTPVMDVPQVELRRMVAVWDWIAANYPAGSARRQDALARLDETIIRCPDCRQWRARKGVARRPHRCAVNS